MLDITTRAAVVGEPQRDYLYCVIVEAGPLGSVSTASSISGINFTKNLVCWADIDFYNEEAFFPEQKSAAIFQKWAGTSFPVSGVEESEKTGQLVFTDDEEGVMFEYWSKCQQLTGTEGVHAPSLGIFQNMQIGIGKVNVSKKKFTSYSRLIRAKVIGVKSTDPKKNGTGTSKVTVTLAWEHCKYDYGMRDRDIWV